MLSTARAKVTSAPQEIASLPSKRLCKVWQSSSVVAGRRELLVEPTSVLDIRSPSPSSTLSSSLAGSCEGPLGSIESTTAVAVSGLFCCEGGKALEGSRFPDCISSLAEGNSSNQDSSVWDISRGNGERAGEEALAMEVGASASWQTCTGIEAPAWERVGEEREVMGAHMKNGEGTSGAWNGAGGCMGSAAENVQAAGNSFFHRGIDEGKGLERMENVCKAEQFSFPTARASISGGHREAMAMNVEELGRMVKEEGRLEACVIHCLQTRKRDQGDSLGEVVQKVSGGGRQKEEWVMGEWNEFSPVVSGIPTADDLGEMVPAAGASTPHEWWVQAHSERSTVAHPPPPQQQQQPGTSPRMMYPVACAGGGGIATVSTKNSTASSSSSSPSALAKSQQQLDLYEAMQAGLLYSNSGKGKSSSSTNSSPIDTKPSLTANPLHRQFHAALLPPDSATAAVTNSGSHSIALAPSSYPSFSSLDNKLLPQNTVIFSSLQFPNLPFHPTPPPPPPPPSQPSSELLSAPHILPLSHSCSTTYSRPPFGTLNSKPNHRSHSTSEFVESKLWQMRPLEGEGMLSKARSANWQVKGEPQPAGWNVSLGGEEGPGRGGMTMKGLLPSHVSSPPQQHLSLLQASSEHQMPPLPRMVGRRVPLEDLLLAQRQLSAAMEALDLGNTAMAQAILARLNHLSSPEGQPSQRAIFYFKEALAQRFVRGSAGCSYPQQHQQHHQQQEQQQQHHHLLHQAGARSSSSLDIISKVDAYKSFCEVSPIPQFAHFTTNQAILEAMEGESCIHVIDFELGLGGQWASFMQEISQRSGGPPELIKITTVGVSDSVEMQLAKENLLQFARELGLTLHLDALPVPGLGCLKAIMFGCGESDAVVINFGFGLSRLLSDFSSTDALISFFQFIKSLCPKVVTVVDSEFGFEGSSALLDSLQFYSCIFESLESIRLAKESVLNIETLLFAPKIATLMQGRKASALDNLPPWRALLQSTGFTSINLSNAAETQAGCLVKSPSHNGFSVKKQHGYLFLYWMNQPLVAASTWVC